MAGNLVLSAERIIRDTHPNSTDVVVIFNDGLTLWQKFVANDYGKQNDKVFKLGTVRPSQLAPTSKSIITSGNIKDKLW
jgi:hypothetical protein